MLEIFQKYAGSGLILIWFMVALVYLFLREKRKHLRIIFIYAPTIILLLFFNPLFFKLFYAAVGEEIYFRICWLLPIIAVIGYAAVLLYDSLPKDKKAGYAIIVAVLIAISGKLVYTSPLFSKAENSYHVPQEVVDICDAIQIEGREVMAAFPDEFLLYVRQYSPVVCMPYGREALTGTYNELNIQIMSDEIDVEKLATLAKAKNCHYVILAEGKTFLGDMEDYDYEIFDTMHGYVIYKDTTMNFRVP